MPIRVAARSKSLACNLSLAAILGSNPAGRMGVLSLMSVVCCQSSLRRADHSCRGVLPSVLCPMSVITNRHKERP
jgi:hypothetical protein